MTNGDILNLGIRSKIYNYIYDNPGLHFSKLSRDLNISKTTLGYHIDVLKRSNLIVESNLKGYQRYYIKENASVRYKKYLDLLHVKTYRHILLVTLTSLVVSRKDLIDSLELHASTVDKNIATLLEMNILETAPARDGVILRTDGGTVSKTPKGREKFYRITESAIEDIYESFIIFQKTIFDREDIGSIIDTFDRANVVPKKVGDRQKSLEELFFEMFPHPYHI